MCRKAIRDEFAYPINDIPEIPRVFCCDKHKHESMIARQEYLDKRFHLNLNDLRSIIQRVRMELLS